AERLAHLHSEALTDFEGLVLSERIRSYLCKPPPNSRRLLLMIDGADEISGKWGSFGDLLPRVPSAGVKILISARTGAADELLQQIEWDESGICTVMDLKALAIDGVAEILIQSGVALAEDGSGVALTDEFYRLTVGDPLLIKLYLGDLNS